MQDFTRLEREVPQQENINALNEVMRHEEEVQRQLEQRRFSPLERAMFIWAKGSQGQKLSMVTNLHNHVNRFEPRHLEQLLVEMNDTMWSQAVEVQTAVPKALQELLNHMHSGALVRIFNCCTTMLNGGNIEVREVWGQLLVELVSVLPPALAASHVLPLALQKSEHSVSSDLRILSCLILGCLCFKLDRDILSTILLKRSLALCQDTDVKVRAAICSQLGKQVAAVGLEKAKHCIMPEVFELLRDEGSSVSRAAFSCLVDTVDHFDSSYRCESLYPIFRSYVKSPPTEIHELMVEKLGQLLVKIQNDIQATDATLYAQFFLISCQKGSADIRSRCAFNLPAAVASLPSSTHAPYFFPAIRLLTADAHDPVRRAVAAGLSDLFPLLGTGAALCLKNSFLALLSDPSLEVRHLIINQQRKLLQFFAQQLSLEERGQFFRAVLDGVISYDVAVGKHWRRLSAILDALQDFNHYMEPQLIHDLLIPSLVIHVKNAAVILLDDVSDLIMNFISQLRNSPQIAAILCRLESEFGRSSSCYHRCTFLRMFRAATRYFSRQVIRVKYIEVVVELSKDPIANVRAAVARATPEWRQLLKIPVEEALMEKFAIVVQSFQMDSDDVVRDTIRESLVNIDRVARAHDQQAILGEIDEDKLREQNEGNLIDVVRELEANQRRSKLKELLKIEREKDTASESSTKRVVAKGANPKFPATHKATPSLVSRNRPHGGIAATKAPSTAKK